MSHEDRARGVKRYGASPKAEARTAEAVIDREWSNGMITLRRGDVLAELRAMDAGSVQMCMTSPPYFGIRDFQVDPLIWGGVDDHDHEWGDARRRDFQTPGAPRRSTLGGRKKALGTWDGVSGSSVSCACGAWMGHLGLEPRVALYVEHMVSVFRELWRVLRDDGVVWLNIGDSYATGKGKAFNPGGSYESKGTLRKRAGAHPQDRGNKSELVADGLKPKDLIGVPWRLGLALQADGWWLRSSVIWHKTNVMPESTRDRPTLAHEYLLMLTKSGDPLYWTFEGGKKRRRPGTRTKPEAFYHWRFRRGGDHSDACSESCRRGEHRGWERRNYWVGHDYFYDGDAIKEPNSPDGRSETKFAGAPTYDGLRNDAVGGWERWPVGGKSKRSVWSIPNEPFAGDHYATYPKKLCEAPIQSSSSAHGACGECGAPWERVVEKTEDESTTVGWESTCGHDAEIVPCKVLDIFAGTGTTLLVAQRLGRHGVGLELSPEYFDMAVERISTQPLGMALDT